jgi:hypothetical protein
MIEMVEMIVGVINAISTWRFLVSLLLALSAALLAFLYWPFGGSALPVAAAIVVAGAVIGMAWQSRFEQEKRRGRSAK